MPELTRRYVVMTMAAAAPFDHADRDAPFVLKPWKDPAALAALKAYRRHCYPELARDLDEWIRVIEAGPALRGDVGQRNEAHLASSKSALARPAARGPGTGEGESRGEDEHQGQAAPRARPGRARRETHEAPVTILELARLAGPWPPPGGRKTLCHPGRRLRKAHTVRASRGLAYRATLPVIPLVPVSLTRCS